MGRGLAATATGSGRKAYSRNNLAKTLGDMKRITWLSDDDVELQRRGESITRISYFVIETHEDRHRYRAYVTPDGRIADFIEG